MKKLFLALIALGSVVLLNAQSSDQSAKKEVKKDCIKMQDGKLWQEKDGNTTEVTEDVTLPNGTIVTKDGNVKMKDGSTVALKDGDYVWMDGKITHGKPKKKDDGGPRS